MHMERESNAASSTINNTYAPVSETLPEAMGRFFVRSEDVDINQDNRTLVDHLITYLR